MHTLIRIRIKSLLFLTFAGEKDALPYWLINKEKSHQPRGFAHSNMTAHFLHH